MIAITYICPVAKNHPIGGVKVIHQHVETLANAGVDCFISQVGHAPDASTWFESRARNRPAGSFDPGKDFLVVPEVWAEQFGRQCYEQGLKYAIFVQNGYRVCDAADGAAAALTTAYERASLILSISEDTSAMIALAYPQIPAARIVRVLPRVGDQFAPGPKSKMISYMPRKLPEHVNVVRRFLEPHLPQGWTMTAIDKQHENAVTEILARTSVFLSFCDQEGFGLPPLEAALSGASVVGYTGQGANEYFRAPNFTAVANGDFRSFIQETRRAMDDVERGLLQRPDFVAGIAGLRQRYSRQSERDHLLAFAAKVEGLYKG